MTIVTQYEPLTYAGDGSSTAFPVTWPYQFDTDIVVSTTVVSTGVTTILAEGTGYSISPINNSPANTGTVTLLTGPLAVGTNLTIQRKTPLTQSTTWVPNGSNPTSAIQNATDKLTMIAQELEAQIEAIPSGGSGSGGIVTTATFTVAAISASQTVSVNTTAGLVVGNNVQISNVALTMVGQVTALTATTLTITTLAVPVGSAGSVMPIGAPVQLGVVPGATTINVQDSDASPSGPAGVMVFNGSSTLGSGAASTTGIDLYVKSITGGSATIVAQPNLNFSIGNIRAPSNSGAFRKLAYLPGTGESNPSQWATLNGSTNPFGVLRNNSGFMAFGLVVAGDLAANSITPAAVSATNSPSAGQIPSFTSSGQFTWVNNGSGGGLPGGGTTSLFLRGDTTWSSFLNTAGSPGALFFGTSEATNAYAGYVSNAFGTPSGFNYNLAFGIAKKGVSNWSGVGAGVYTFDGVIAVNASTATYSSIDASNVEVAQFGGANTSTNFVAGIVRGQAFRSGAGYWKFAYTVPATSGSITLDVQNGAYQRQSVTGPITYTLADSTPAPTSSGFQYANELTLEITSPGANTITWPGTVTWANGASAPALSGSGINVIRLIRRQGQTQWVGIVENGAAAGTYTDAQARNAVLQSTYLLNSTTIGWTINPGVSAQPAVLPLSITGGLIANSTIVPNTKLAATGTASATTFLRGDNTWATPVGSGLTYQAQPAPPAAASTLSPFSTLVFGRGLNALVSGTTATLTVTNGLYNIVDYGADPSGTLDSTAAFTAAYNAANTNGGTVYVPPGTFKITSTLTLTGRANIRGEGCSARAVTSSNVVSEPTAISNLSWGGASGQTMLVFQSAAPTIPTPVGYAVEGIGLDGNSVAGTGIAIHTASGCAFRRISIKNCTSFGLDLLANVNNTGIEQCSFVGTFVDVSASTSAVGIRLDCANGVTGADAFMNSFVDTFVIHNYKGIVIGNSDNNLFMCTQVYSGASSQTAPNGVIAGIVFDGSLSAGGVNNTFYNVVGSVWAVNNTVGIVYNQDPINSANGPWTNNTPFAYVDSTSSLYISNRHAGSNTTTGYYPNGEWFYFKGMSAGSATPANNHVYSMFFDSSYYSPVGGTGTPTLDLYLQSPVRNNGNPVALNTL